MKIAIIINADRATTEIKDKLNDPKLAQTYGFTYDTFYPEPKNIEKVLESINYKAYNACLVGGGDGTVRTVIQTLIDKDLPLAILPMGTFNLLAKTLKYPESIEEMFKIIQSNKTKKIDIAEVNGTICINHAWIGFYYYMIKMREKHKEFIGRNKLLKLIFNSFNLFRVLPVYHLQLVTEHGYEEHYTCLLYVGNNSSSMNVLNFGERQTLSSGLLEVCVLKCQTRWELFLFMISVILNKDFNKKYVTQFAVKSFVVNTKSQCVNMVIDGELFKFKAPLKFTNHQKQLTVIIP